MSNVYETAEKKRKCPKFEPTYHSMTLSIRPQLKTQKHSHLIFLLMTLFKMLISPLSRDVTKICWVPCKKFPQKKSTLFFWITYPAFKVTKGKFQKVQKEFTGFSSLVYICKPQIFHPNGMRERKTKMTSPLLTLRPRLLFSFNGSTMLRCFGRNVLELGS